MAKLISKVVSQGGGVVDECGALRDQDDPSPARRFAGQALQERDRPDPSRLRIHSAFPN